MFPDPGEALPQEVAQHPQRYVRVDQEAQEMGKCGHGYAIPRPGTMMIHPGYTSCTVTTVMCPSRFGSSAFVAPSLAISLNNTVFEDITARVGGNGAIVRYPKDKEEAVESDGFAT
jgi:hypothetical protein